MTHSDEILNKVLQLSERMLELAVGGDWDAVLPLEKERRDLIADCFNRDNPFQDAELAAGRLQWILELDCRLIDMGTAHRGELGAALKKLQRGRNATKAYHHCGG